MYFNHQRPRSYRKLCPDFPRFPLTLYPGAARWITALWKCNHSFKWCGDVWNLFSCVCPYFHNGSVRSYFILHGIYHRNVSIAVGFSLPATFRSRLGYINIRRVIICIVSTTGNSGCIITFGRSNKYVLSWVDTDTEVVFSYTGRR
jgi:hypothetical protein